MVEVPLGIRGALYAVVVVVLLAAEAAVDVLIRCSTRHRLPSLRTQHA